MGIKNFSNTEKKPKDLQALKQVRNRIKITNNYQANTGQEGKKGPTAN